MILICGLVFSIDLILKSVFSKLSFKKLSIEPKKLDLILEVSATDTVDEKIKAYNVEVLDDLTQEEVDKIAVRQKATSSVG